MIGNKMTPTSGHDHNDRVLSLLRQLQHKYASQNGAFIICKLFGLSTGELEEYIGRLVAEGGPR